MSSARAAGSVKGVMCAVPGRILRVALGRRLARADMAAGVDTWSSSAAMSVAGSFFAAVPGLPGSGARVQAGHGQRGLWRRTLRGQ